MTEHDLTAHSLNKQARRIVAIVAALNLVGCVAEVTIAGLIGSASLFADAADFLEDFFINFLVLAALGWSVIARRKASFGLAALILIPAFAAFGMAIWKILSGNPPEPFALSFTAVFAMIINMMSALLLMRLRHGSGALARGAWLAARNDIFANILILLGGIITIVWLSIWPDVIIGIVIGIINLSAAKEVLEQAQAEEPELEMT
ncbi:cation transporter [Corynebacterium sp. sy039]|uniref:cation transporter n=1 Tax=Corynebacterium sp. sy039 TaxID=2599641 RepID=UPI0011B6689E|nr:cation transporter [Corynebacterium sp. sy039]QDZ41823.1 cation transporter [Corynebacterium sp. sy039]